MGSPSLAVSTVSVDVRATLSLNLTLQSLPNHSDLCGSRCGRPGLLVPNSPYGFYGRKATLNSNLAFQSSGVLLGEGTAPYPQSSGVLLGEGTAPYPQSSGVLLGEGTAPYPQSSGVLLGEGTAPYPQSSGVLLGEGTAPYPQSSGVLLGDGTAP